MATKGGNPFDDPERWEEDLYDRFPSGAEHGFGDAEGFNRYTRVNDRSLFTEAALEDPVIQAFVDANFSVSFAQFKSSSRESEWALHKPHRTMAGEVDGIGGPVDRYPGPADAHIATFIINHERTMARWKQSVVVMEDGRQAGQMVYKEEDPSQG